MAQHHLIFHLESKRKVINNLKVSQKDVFNFDYRPLIWTRIRLYYIVHLNPIWVKSIFFFFLILPGKDLNINTLWTSHLFVYIMGFKWSMEMSKPDATDQNH